MKLYNNDKGFSMLEILVALLLAGIILASMFQSTVHFQRSIQRNEEQIRATFIAASVTAWWRVTASGQQPITDYLEYSPIPSETGLQYASEFMWRIETNEDNIKFIVVMGPRLETVRFPLGAFHE